MMHRVCGLCVGEEARPQVDEWRSHDARKFTLKHWSDWIDAAAGATSSVGRSCIREQDQVDQVRRREQFASHRGDDLNPK